MSRTFYKFFALFMTFLLVSGCSASKASSEEGDNGNQHLQIKENVMVKKVIKSDKEWKEILTPEQYLVLRKSDTERAFTGKYNDHYEKGIYVCAACGTPLFSSETKYDHGTGWPSYTAPVDKSHIDYHNDYSLLMKRTEVRCAACGSHLGHVFDDGPAPTHKHYCINSVALNFKPNVEAESAGKDSHSFAEEKNELVVTATTTFSSSSANAPAAKEERGSKTANMETATFAAGCFWGVEDTFRKVKSVISTRVGYMGGKVENPTYRMVCSDKTGHAESIEIVFDPSVASYAQLLEYFFLLHDPTQVNKQGPDTGTQYRSVIFYHSEEQKEAALKMIERLEKSGKYDKPIATQVVAASEFYQAEEYHQQYYKKLRKDR